MSKKQQETYQELDKFLTALGKVLMILGEIMWQGLRRFNSALEFAALGAFCLLIFALGYRYHQLHFLHWGDLMGAELAKSIAHWGRVSNGLILAGFMTSLVLLVLGFGRYCARVRAQKALDRLGIKAGMGCAPKLIKVHSLGEHRQRLTIASEGVGISHYQKREGDIEAAF